MTVFGYTTRCGIVIAIIFFPYKGNDVSSVRDMKKVLITIAVTIIFWMVIAKAVTGCYTAICKGY